jgi:hypothetical protein
VFSRVRGQPENLLVFLSCDTNKFRVDTNMALTDIKVRTLKSKNEPFKIGDGEGLFLLVQPNGSKLW